MFTSLKYNSLLVLAITSLISGVALAAPSENLKSQMATLGNIKEVKETESKGIYAWYLEKNGKTLVVYNTPDEKSFLKVLFIILLTKKLYLTSMQLNL